MFCKKLSSMFLILVSVSTMKSYATNISPAECAERWAEDSATIMSADNRSYEAMLASWQQREATCAGSVVYEARLAMLYSLLNQPEKSRDILKPYLKTTSRYAYLVDLALLQADEAEVKRRAITEKDMQSLENKYSLFVKKHPEALEGYAFLGGIKSALAKHEEAIPLLERALPYTLNLSSVYRSLTISYMFSGRYKDAIAAADNASKYDKSLFSDQYFMYSVARSNAALGDFRSAENALKLLVMKKPEVRQDDDFKDTVSFIKAKMSATK